MNLSIFQYRINTVSEVNCEDYWKLWICFRSSLLCTLF